MDTICPIDSKCAFQISALLHPPPSLQVQEYFEELITSWQCHGIQIKQNGDYGKGVYTDSGFKEGDLVLKDQMLVGIQHPSNKIDCLVCSFCLQFIGSIELQIGRKFYLQNLDVSTSNVCDSKDSAVGASSSSNDKVALPNGVVESLMNGELVLPHSDKFPMPSAISCPRGCGEAYYC